MWKFENEQEKKVREILWETAIDYFKADDDDLEDVIDKGMLRIRPYLKVQKKRMGDAL